MYKKIFIFSFLFFISLSTGFAQNGYDITIDTKNSKGATILLSFFDGTFSNAILVDSAIIKSNQEKVKIVNTKKILGSIYKLSFKGADKVNTINIVVDNGAKLNFQLEDSSMFSIKTNQPLNKDFIEFQRNIKSNDDKKMLLEQLNKKYPQSVAGLFAKLELRKLKTSQANNTVDKSALRDSFFTGIDLQDKRMPVLPNSFSFLFSYINLLPITNENYIANVASLMKGMDCSSRNYIFYLDWVFKNLTYFEKYKLGSAYRYTYSTYLDKEPCKTQNKKLYDKITAEVAKLDEVGVGKTIPDFEMQDTIGNVYTIKSIYTDNKYTFLAFYDPDCSHCQEMMPKIATYFKNKKLDSVGIKKISFLNIGDTVKMKSFADMVGLTSDWLSVKAKTGNLQYIDKLKVSSNPAFFLLDQNGTILLRRFSPEDLNEIFK